ncbi:MAG: NifB/NifX family molybdenum-iron cluster-binding protein [Myxococcota bacterium]|jgi:predicted Fe-Mo cluster-binding NifX family protein
MKVCIPVNSNSGHESEVCRHFGSAPFFMIADTDSTTCSAIANNNAHHAHGMCQPLRALAGLDFDCIVVGGIGMGALMKLQSSGVAVYLSREEGTVRQALDSIKNGLLEKVTPGNACAGHGH